MGKTLSRRPDFWLLCGIALGLLLVLARWRSLHAEGEDLQHQIRLAQAEAEELRPIILEVKAFQARQKSFESLITDLAQRPRLFVVTETVLAASAPDVVLERLDVHGREVRIQARADDERVVQRFIDSLRESELFLQASASDAPVDAAPDPPRFVVLGELRPPGTGGEE